MFSEAVKKYAIQCHENTNHLYDGYLPYQFHLRMAVSNAIGFKGLISKKEFISEVKTEEMRLQNEGMFRSELPFEIVASACWCHDLIEDCRENYNSIMQGVSSTFSSSYYCGISVLDLSKEIADIVYAVTNEKGHNRKERESDKYFEGIRNTPFAVFVKLCDRLANIQYSKLTAYKSGAKLKMYELEHAHFKEQLYDEQYKEMFDHMQKLFTEK